MTYNTLLTQFSKGQAKTGLPFAKNFAVLVLAVLQLRTVCLYKLRTKACVYVLAVVHGIINPTSERVTTKKYRDQKSYPSISLFRLGYDFLLSSIITVSCLLACLLKLKKPKNPVVFQIPFPPDKAENVQ